MNAISRIRDKIAKDGYKRDGEMRVARRLGLAVQWAIMDSHPLTGDVSWVRANNPSFEHHNVQIDGVRITWPAE